MKNLIELKQKDGLYSLTDIWKASGLGEDKKPAQWLRWKPAKEFINHISQSVDTHLEKHIVVERGGNNSGTFSHWQIALAYAKYLSPKLHAQVNQVFKERLEENQNPSLGIDRAVDRAEKSYLKQGKPNKWVSKRIMSKAIRLSYTDTLHDHGCDGIGIGMNTNTQYKELFGEKATELKKRRGLEKKDNLRDDMSMLELAQLSLSEELAADRIEKDSVNGNWPCNDQSKMAARSVRCAIENFNQPAQLTVKSR